MFSFVEAFIPRIVRQQFWLLLAPSGGALFTSAKFSQQFKYLEILLLNLVFLVF